MNLKEKFEQWFINDEDEHYIGMINEVCLDHEKIADDFAIGFTEWFADNTLRVDLDGYKIFGDTDETKPHTIKELLEIYKKEKHGL